MHEQITTLALPADFDVRSYLLGIFDGEGCISGGRNKDGRWSLQVSVCMASESICRLFQSVWGGSVTMRNKPTVGGLMLWQWQQPHGASGIEFLEFVAARSMTKAMQARAAIPLAQNIAKYSQRGYRRGVALNRGHRIISNEDMAIREQTVRLLRSLNGGRSRFIDQPATSPEILSRATDGGQTALF